MTIRADSFALTPKLGSPVAQYALRGHGAETFPDRSGHGLALVQLYDTNYAPDGYPDTCLHAGRIVSAAYPQLFLASADLTITVRACARYTGARQFLYSENDGSAVAGTFVLICEPDGRLMAGVETTSQVSYVWLSDLRVRWGRWALYSLRRNVAAGTWTIGVNKQYQTCAPQVVTVPLNGSVPKLYAGGPDVSDLVWQGAIADLSLWDVRKSDAEVSAIVDAVGIDASTTPAAFMPTLYQPLAHWPLNFASSEAQGLADVSGNGRALSKVSLVDVAADRVQGALSPKGASGAGTKFVHGALGSADTTWCLTGPCTVVCRVLFDGDGSRTQVLFQSNYYPYAPSPIRCVPLTLATVGPSGTLFSYAQHGSNSPDTYQAALVPTPGRWCVVSFRRAASGVLTFGVNMQFEDSPALPMPGPCAPGLQLGILNSNDGIAPLAWGGQMADFQVWDQRLTDQQLAPLVRAAMGKGL